MFKKLTGGDEMSVQGKYMKGVTLSFTAKLTFYLNDRPKWAEVSAAFPKALSGSPLGSSLCGSLYSVSLAHLWLPPWLPL